MELNEAQVNKATSALLKYFETTKKNDLLADESPVWLVLATKIPPEHSKVKPIRIPLKYPIYNKDAEVCLITKDPQSEYKEMLKEQGITRINKVIGVTKLKKKYKPYEAKRQLCNSYDIFLSDDRVIPILPKLIGKSFYEKKKNPVPIKMRKGILLKEITNALNSTYYFINSGGCSSIKIGLTNQTPEEIAENIMYSINYIVEKVPGKWKNIQRLSIKTNKSISLPIYSSLPDEAKKIEFEPIKKVDEDEKDEENEEDEKDEENNDEENEEEDGEDDDDDEDDE
ncbi:ribosomal protein L1 [Neocallimastix californiae]|jgi:ribosome biogenesis protein UTP30|uniref:Ribosomal L1 domain-containing protein 1 n=1 Tax=Neocallimastix californiae TaxID=1754190 RepID=A0A1Y1ZYQ4_9FUNG|nr:ribosomal protein L1 [Neocallimastix californiae]|eukprot:ORY15372.1 ribosomal protein L1 [Neocallimastix californiae]